MRLLFLSRKASGSVLGGLGLTFHEKLAFSRERLTMLPRG
jgi:hypothetical protein